MKRIFEPGGYPSRPFRMLCLTLLVLYLAQWGIIIADRAQAAPVPAKVNYLPVAQGGTINAQTAQIYTCQCGGATAWVDGDGTVMVTFLSHDQGGKTIVAIDTGTTFTPLPGPLNVFPGEPLPAFDAPGLKDAPGMAVKAFGRRVLYMPIRTVPEGNYNLWRVVW